jgi:hypothetical protein
VSPPAAPRLPGPPESEDAFGCAAVLVAAVAFAIIVFVSQCGVGAG